MLREDNNGFISFPVPGKEFERLETGKTFVYLVAFDSQDFVNEAYELSNVNLNLSGNFVADDISVRSEETYKQALLESDEKYFPNVLIRNGVEFTSSIPLTTCICIGWSDFSVYLREENIPWCASFRDLTNEGRKMYYSIKKLHNTKEVRILTFNNIK